MSNLFEELKRRNVFKVGVAYAIVAWVVIQGGEIVLEAFGLDSWVKILIIIVALGFPLTLFLAWVYEVTPEGVKKDHEAQKFKDAPKGQKLNRIIQVGFVLAVGFIVYQQVRDHYWESRDVEKMIAEASIAVLPFQDFSENRDQEYFANGISEEILNLLAQVEGLKVTSRSSSFSFKGQNIDIPTVASRLGVNHVLEGSVRRSGDRVRVTAQLIETETDSHLWSETYDRNVTDIFTLQDEIAGAIVDALKISLVVDNVTMVNPAEGAMIEAYDLYLLGRHRMAQRTQENLEEARAYFEEAVAIDPDFAQARAALAQSIILLTGRHYGDLGADEIRALAIPELETALELDPNLAEAYGVYGLYYMTLEDYPESQRALETALELNPNYAEAWTWVSSVYSGTFQFEKAMEALEKGYTLDPLSLLGRLNYGGFKSYLGDMEEATQIALSIIQDYPEHPFGYAGVASIYRVEGRLAEALQLALTGLEKDADVGGNKNIVEDTLADLGSAELSEQVLGYVSPLVAIAAGGGEEALENLLVATPLDSMSAAEQSGVANLMMVFGDQEAAYAVLDPIFGQGYNARSPLLDPTMEGLGTTGYAWLLKERGELEAHDKMLAFIKSRLELFLSTGSYPDFWYGYVRLLVLEGKNDEAIEELSALVDSGFRAWYVKIDFVTAPLHDDSRFQDIVRRIDAAVEIEREKIQSSLQDQ